MKKAPLSLALLAVAGLLSPGLASGQPIGAVDEPTAGQHVSGIVRVSGFVLDFLAIDRVDLFIDGSALPTNTADLALPRPDVLRTFPNYANSPNAARPGFLTSFYTRSLSDGPHSVVVRATESNGAKTDFGPITVIVDNTINQAPFGYIDTPNADVTEVLSGSYPITGWALDDQGIDHIDFLVDGQIVATAIGRIFDPITDPQTGTYGATRPDVAAAFPDVPFALYSGFLANIETTRLPNGIHQVSVKVTDSSGESRTIGTRTVQINNNGAFLLPFGRVDVPLDQASLHCQPATRTALPPNVCPSPCFPPGPTGQSYPVSFFSNFVKGWALDTGAPLEGGEVDFVELLFDGVPIVNTKQDCIKIGTALMNCYGVNRPDVARQYSGYANADESGFNMAFALQEDTTTGLLNILIPGKPGGALITGVTSSGAHTLALRVGDNEGLVAQIDTIAVDVLCDFSVVNPDRPAFGFIDTPSEYQFIDGMFVLSGWAWDFDGGISSLDVEVDGQLIANLTAAQGTYGLYRPDVPANDIRVPTPYVGFFYPLDTTHVSDTEHEIAVYAWDKPGFGIAPRRSEVGRRRAVVLNNSPIKQ
jgi:hypothetical protein